MKFFYKKFTSGVERPIIPITVRNPATGLSVRYHALVDSGADRCMFAGEIGELIGLDLLKGIKRTVSGVIAGQSRPYYLHDVEIGVGEWHGRAGIGFMPDLSSNGHGVLGQSCPAVRRRRLRAQVQHRSHGSSPSPCIGGSCNETIGKRAAPRCDGRHNNAQSRNSPDAAH
jgi:hypothetical protein